jgi:hypothetical protein
MASAALIEQYFTPQQLAERLVISTNSARRLFQNEPGVVKIGEPSRRLGRALKRRYYTMRVPQSVAERVIARMTNKK